MRGTAMTKVLVLHSVCLVRSALAALLRSEGGFEVTSSARRGARARTGGEWGPRGGGGGDSE
ncbi:hypothetical protein ACFXPH_25020, partial [Streptomyces goshikiensis]